MVTEEIKKEIEGVIIFGKPHIFDKPCKLFIKFALIPIDVSVHDGNITKSIWMEKYYEIDYYSSFTNSYIPYIRFAVKDLTYWV